MYKRDFGILALAVFSVYFALQNEGPFTFNKAWYYPLSERGAGISTVTEVLPKPVLIDLNGDGSLETVLVTHDDRLVVLRGRGVGNQGDGFALAELMAEISLRPSSFHTIAGHRPVALAAGYIDKPAGDLVHRPQKAVIVVLAENWRLTCYDHNLNVLWYQDIHKEMKSHATIHEVAIMITHQTVYEADRGLIIVGGSMNLAASLEEDSADDTDPFQREFDAEAREEAIRHEQGAQEGLRELHEGQMKGADVSRHFSYYAYEGGTGASRWNHLGTGFSQDLGQLKDDLSPQNNYKLQAEHLNAMDYSEVSCRDYRESVLRNLPHQWLHRIDTEFTLSHFVKHKYGKGERKKHLAATPERIPTKSPCSGEKCTPDAVAKVLEKVSNKAGRDGRALPSKLPPPNVLVAHLQEGLEAMHLYSGRAICKLHLPPGGLHVDLNGDGVLDHIRAVGKDPRESQSAGHHRLPHCYAYAFSGVPPHEPFFNGSLCGNMWTDAFAYGRSAENPQSMRDTLDIAPPAFLPLPTPTGEPSFRYGQKGMALFLNSHGEVTAFSPRGHIKWRVTTDCQWNSIAAQKRRGRPTLKPLPVRVHALPSAILVGGIRHASILSEHGNLLSTFSLPEPGVVPLEIVDLNGDGLNDVLLMTDHMVYGYIQVQNLGGKPFGMLVLCLIVAMGTIYASQHVGNESTKKIKRSTDRAD